MGNLKVLGLSFPLHVSETPCQAWTRTAFLLETLQPPREETRLCSLGGLPSRGHSASSALPRMSLMSERGCRTGVMSACQDWSGEGDARDAVHWPPGAWGRTSFRQGESQETTVGSGAVD